MANEKHLAILRQGIAAWNAWREENPTVSPINLSDADLTMWNLSGANLSRADLFGTTLRDATLTDANLRKTDLRNTDLRATNLSGADLSGANLSGANLSGANLRETDLSGAALLDIMFSDVDLSRTKGLDMVRRYNPSGITISTLVLSRGIIPEAFLRSCGVPHSFIEYLPALIGAMDPLQFYSCFISHSSKDQDFAQRLYERMQNHHLRVWFAPEHMKGGQKVYEQIDQAIRVHDKLVLVLSEESIRSSWVETEIRKARKAELRDNRRKLFPIRLVDFETFRDWECFDADTGKDLAVEVREYFIPDFTRWKDPDAFERAFASFLKDLQATEAPPMPTLPKASGSTKTMPQNPQTVIAAKKRQLEKREEQAAFKGSNTPLYILMEIEDLRKELGELEGGQ